MDGSHGSCGGGSRRRFLKTAAATGAAASLTTNGASAADPPKGLPTIKLGKTEQTVTRLGMGTSWTVQPSFVQAAIAAGVKYIDTAEGYESGNSEKTVGEVLERTGKRKDVYLVTKIKDNFYSKAAGPDALQIIERQLMGSLQRLRTDYTDGYFLHGMAGRNIGLLTDPTIKGAFEALKKSGKIRFAGLSCHDRQLVEIVETAAKCGWIDQIMIQYNYRTMNADELRRAVDAASKANIGLVAMKTQGGSEPLKPDVAAKFPKVVASMEKGFNAPQAAIKAVLADERFHVVVSEMTNRTQLGENMAAVREPLTAKEARLLEEHRERTARLYCHGCGHLCETAAKGVAVADVLRYLRYYQAYGKRQEARALYQALPPEARDLASADLAAAEAACPHGLPVAQLVQTADKRLG